MQEWEQAEAGILAVENVTVPALKISRAEVTSPTLTAISSRLHVSRGPRFPRVGPLHMFRALPRLRIFAAEHAENQAKLRFMARYLGT